ncbi:MAG: hypothetical protein LBD93_04150 [Treponema sp.]|nr:hypothetical protein [Treponema sp.]
MKHGEIADLNQMVAAKTLEATKAQDKADLRLVIIICLGVTITAYITFKILRLFRSV